MPQSSPSHLGAVRPSRGEKKQPPVGPIRLAEARTPKGKKRQLQFRAEPQVEACLQAYIDLHPDITLSNILNFLVAQGLRNVGLDPWLLPQHHPKGSMGATRQVCIADTTKLRRVGPDIVVPFSYPTGELTVLRDVSVKTEQVNEVSANYTEDIFSMTPCVVPGFPGSDK